MSSKVVNIDTRSEIAEVFGKFIRLFKLPKYPHIDVYSLSIKCIEDSSKVEITIKSKEFDYYKVFDMNSFVELDGIKTIIESFDRISVEIESFSVLYNSFFNIFSIKINSYSQEGFYVRNKNTQKLELHFEKEYYQSLPNELSSSIKSNYLFSRKESCWVSRAKFPNLYWAEKVAEQLGLINCGVIGESLSFEEQMNRKAERANNRAARYEILSEKANQRGEQLQKPINDKHGDVAFFTQPNINSSSGRAFSRQREQMFEAYEKGFEEFKKSKYYKEKAKIALETAENTKPTDKAFIVRRIEDAEKTIKAQGENLKKYNSYFKRLEDGEKLTKLNREPLTIQEVERWISNATEIIDQAISKSIYYHSCLEEVGGVAYSKENICKGYIINHKRWGKCEVGGTGPKNFTYVILEGGDKGMGGSSSYADIEEVISKDVVVHKHPFKVGEIYSIKHWDGNEYVDKSYEIVKITDERVILKSGNEKAISRKPKRMTMRNDVTWAVTVREGYSGTFYKKED